MNQRFLAIILVFFLCLSLVLVLFPDRGLVEVGCILFGLTAAYPVFSLLRFSPKGWKAKQTSPLLSILHPRISGVCIPEELLLGPVSIQGDLILPGGTYPVSRIRSLPDGVLLSAALAATYEHMPQKDDIAALFPEMNLAPAQFQSRFPFLRTLHLSSIPGQVVQDGTGERVFFCIDSSKDDRIRFMHNCQLVQNEGKTRELELDEKRQLLDLSAHAVLLFTGIPHGNQVDRLTLLGAVSFRHVQSFDSRILSDIRSLESRETEVFLAHPLQGADGVSLGACPVPVHEAGNHTVILERESEQGLSLDEAVEQIQLCRKTTVRLFFHHGLFVVWLSVLASLSSLPGPAALPFFLIPLIFPFFLRRHIVRTIPSAPSDFRIIFLLLSAAVDILIIFLLFLFGEDSVWQRAIIFHMLMGTVLECACLPHCFLALPFPSWRFLLFLFLALLIVTPAAAYFCHVEGVFCVLLAALFGLSRLILALRKSSRS